jgi:protoporphyrinogen oxidase
MTALSAPIVILGGGLSGMAAAHALARAGCSNVTIVERGPKLGGLAGSFQHEGHSYPLGYHHILHRDLTLLYVLDAIGALPEIRWRRVRMFFRLDERLHDLGSPAGFLRFPMSLADKARFAGLMLRAFRKTDWTDWMDASAAELVDRWAGPGVRAAIFEPLARLRFERSCQEISAAWLGTRLHYREGSAPLGYQPGANWTTTLCEGYQALIEKLGVGIRVSSPLRTLTNSGGEIREAVLESGERIPGARFVSTVPAEVYTSLAPDDASPGLREIRYTAMISLVCATRQRVEPDFYWMNLASQGHTACGIFLLSSLNPSIGAPGTACVNFVTHLRGRDAEFFARSDAEILAAYREDYRRVFGADLDPFWHRVSRVAMYAPAFVRGYRNPPVRSTSHPNLYFAGSYCSHPTVASTGTAMASGFLAARALLRGMDADTDLPEAADAFRPPSMPRA